MLVSLSTGGNGVNGSRIVPQFLWPCRIHVTAPTFTKRAENSWLSLLAGLPLLLSFCCLIYRQSSTSNKISSQKSISHYFFFFSCLFLLWLSLKGSFIPLGWRKLRLSCFLQWILFSFALSLPASSGQAQEWGAPGPTEIWATWPSCPTELVLWAE